MDADLLVQVKDAIAKAVFGSTFDKLHGPEASGVSEAAHDAYRAMLAFAKRSPERFEVDVKAATPA